MEIEAADALPNETISHQASPLAGLVSFLQPFWAANTPLFWHRSPGKERLLKKSFPDREYPLAMYPLRYLHGNLRSTLLLRRL